MPPEMGDCTCSAPPRPAPRLRALAYPARPAEVRATAAPGLPPPPPPPLQTDNNINELMERVSIGGSRVVQGAGKAVKLLGKLARGLGGTPAAAEPPPRTSAVSAASMAGRQLSSSLGSGPLVAGAAVAAGEARGVELGQCKLGWCKAADCRLWPCPGLPRVPGAAAAAKAQGRASCSRATAAGRHAAAVLPSSPSSFACVSRTADEELTAPGADGSVGGIVDLLVPPDGSVWVAHKCGTVDRYTSAGRRLGSSECGASLTAAACVGQRVWLGFSDGMIRWGSAGVPACLPVACPCLCRPPAFNPATATARESSFQTCSRLAGPLP